MAKVITQTSVASTVKGTGGKILSKLWFVVKVIYFVSLGILISLQAGVESIKEKSPFPILYHTVGKLLSADEQNYYLLKDMEINGIPVENEDTFWNTLKTMFKKGSVWYTIIINITTIGLVYWLVYHFIWIKADLSRPYVAHLRTILTLVVAQMLLSSILFQVYAYRSDPRIEIEGSDKMSDYQLAVKIGQRNLPMKGFALLGYKIFKKISDPRYSIIKEQTISVGSNEEVVQ